jgi:hypothetical protein
MFVGHWPFTIIVALIIIAITVIGKSLLDLLIAIITRATSLAGRRRRHR